MIPIWYKNMNGKYFTLTHFGDGRIGIPAVDLDTQLVFSTRYLDPGKWEYEVTQDRYLLREEK